MNSTTVTANADGSFQSEVRYSAYGEVRHADGTTVTDKLYTSQQQEVEIGLSYYIARWYDPVIAHFIQPDSVIPQASASASYDRYMYVNNNPIKLNDPSGNRACDDYYDSSCKIVLKPNVSVKPLQYPVDTTLPYQGDGKGQPGSDNAPKMDTLPFAESTTLYFWWGFGQNDFTYLEPWWYRKTGGIHPGVDWGIPMNTELRWTVSGIGEVVAIGMNDYGATPNIVIRSGDFLYLFGHISSTPLSIGDYILPGDLIARSGAPIGEPNNVHLHFEVRPADYPNGVYINPLTVMTQDLMEEQFSLFNSGNGTDYSKTGGNALSMMCYPGIYCR